MYKDTFQGYFLCVYVWSVKIDQGQSRKMTLTFWDRSVSLYFRPPGFLLSFKMTCIPNLKIHTKLYSFKLSWRMVSFTAANTKRMFSVSENNKKNRFYSTIHVFHCITYSKCYGSQFLKKYTKIKTNNQKPKKLLYYSLSRVFILRITISGRKECADKLAINSSLSLLPVAQVKWE